MPGLWKLAADSCRRKGVSYKYRRARRCGAERPETAADMWAMARLVSYAPAGASTDITAPVFLKLCWARGVVVCCRTYFGKIFIFLPIVILW